MIKAKRNWKLEWNQFDDKTNNEHKMLCVDVDVIFSGNF